MHTARGRSALGSMCVSRSVISSCVIAGALWVAALRGRWCGMFATAVQRNNQHGDVSAMLEPPCQNAGLAVCGGCRDWHDLAVWGELVRVFAAHMVARSSGVRYRHRHSGCRRVGLPYTSWDDGGVRPCRRGLTSDALRTASVGCTSSRRP